MIPADQRIMYKSNVIGKTDENYIFWENKGWGIGWQLEEWVGFLLLFFIK